ncbi:hypothetical protein CPB86DRAFT_816940 [Serendipita vermifera]|nr:hypothetical protein CPB86DRAFT_816940 [Serendipita vermifera]
MNTTGSRRLISSAISFIVFGLPINSTTLAVAQVWGFPAADIIAAILTRVFSPLMPFTKTRTLPGASSHL